MGPKARRASGRIAGDSGRESNAGCSHQGRPQPGWTVSTGSQAPGRWKQIMSRLLPKPPQRMPAKLTPGTRLPPP